MPFSARQPSGGHLGDDQPMIELMLEAERAMGIGLLDNAERLYQQVVAIDPRNSIAVTGLARVALERGDQRGAYTFARQALALDPDNPMASHLSQRMAEQMRNRGERLPDDLPVPTAGAGGSSDGPPPAPLVASEADPAPADTAPADAAPRTGLVGRLLRRGR
jgi:tetratricopeptide (TPR) repeat protein